MYVLRAWRRFVVARARRRTERLRLALDTVSGSADHVTNYWDLYHGPTDHVLRLLHGYELPAHRRPRPRRVISPWSVGDAESGTVSSNGATRYVAPGYGSVTFWMSIDCE